MKGYREKNKIFCFLLKKLKRSLAVNVEVHLDCEFFALLRNSLRCSDAHLGSNKTDKFPTKSIILSFDVQSVHKIVLRLDL